MRSGLRAETKYLFPLWVNKCLLFFPVFSSQKTAFLHKTAFVFILYLQFIFLYLQFIVVFLSTVLIFFTCGHSQSLVVTRHPQVLVVTRGHSCVLVETIPLRNLCRLEFLNQTAAVFVFLSLLLKLRQRHMRFLVCIRPAHNQFMEQNKDEFQMWLFSFHSFVILLSCMLITYEFELKYVIICNVTQPEPLLDIGSYIIKESRFPRKRDRPH